MPSTSHGCSAEDDTGKVFTWGRADYGQLGRSAVVHDRQREEVQRSSEEHVEQLSNVPVSVPCLAGASEIACGSEHNLAVVGGHCFSWGWNEHGMCGDGTEANVYAPKPITALGSGKPFLIGCGAGHSMVLCQTPGPLLKFPSVPFRHHRPPSHVSLPQQSHPSGYSHIRQSLKPTGVIPSSSMGS
ncbi:unnamed protein product [Caretta caretta]